METIEKDGALDRRKQRTRQAALAAFSSLLMEQGYESVSVAAVAERAGVGRSTLYEHFRTKDDLLDAALDRPLAQLAADPPDPARLQALLEHVRANAGAVRVVLAQPLRSRVARVLAARTAPRLRAHGLAASLAELRALALAEAQLAAMAHWLRGGGPGVAETAAELARLAQLLMRA